MQFKLKLKGFTLSELLVVLIIIGILVMIALPNLLPLIGQAKSTEAKLQLKHLYRLQDTYFLTHSKYAEDAESVGFLQEKLVSEGGSANYRVEIVEAGVGSFLARATSVADFDGDGIFNVWEIDREGIPKETVKD